MISMTTFMTSVPPMLRLFLAIVLTVGITLIFMKVFRRQILQLAQEPEQIDGKGRLPMLLDASASIIGLTTMAFVFFAAFGLSNFWTSTRAADTATQSEAVQYSTAFAYANTLTDPATKTAAVTALRGYRDNVVNVQQPLLENADNVGAYSAQSNAALQTGSVLLTAREKDPMKSPAWANIDDAFTNMTDYGFDRIRALPGHTAVGYIALILILGIVNLVLIAAFRPTTWGRNVFLMIFAATITAVMMYIVVEVSNPYDGSGAVHSILAQIQ